MLCAAARTAHLDIHSYLGSVLAPLSLARSNFTVAVSGGCDSMALAHLLQQWGAKHSAHITALTVNHGLRAASASEAARTHALLSAHGITHHILTPALDNTIRNIQERARIARYDALTAWCAAHKIDSLFVAHTMEDQAETVLLQRHRGAENADDNTSQSGMAFVSYWNNIRIIRPLLGVPKSALVNYLNTHNLQWVEDPTNATNAYARNRLRARMTSHNVVQLWHEAQAHGAGRAQEDELRNTWCKTHATSSELGYITLDIPAFRTLESQRASDILSRAIREIGGNQHRPRHHETARLMTRIAAHPQGKSTLGGCVITWDDAHIIITRELSRLPCPMPVSERVDSVWDNRFTLTFNVPANEASYHIAPLGMAGRTRLYNATRHNKTLRTAMPTFPCLWHLDEPIITPHIDYHNPAYAHCTLKVAYTPPKPLAGAAFWWFNHAPYTNE